MRCKSPRIGWRCVEFSRLMSRPVHPDQSQESPTLDLASECSSFVTGHFDLISASAPHIYHSALVMTPKTSILRKLYEAHARPFVRIVYGALMSWGPNTATTTLPAAIELAVWSQCGKFIAIGQRDAAMVDILDSAFLQRLQTLDTPQGIPTSHRSFVFSPGSRILTCSSGGDYGQNQKLFLVSWDLQTGGVVSVIRWEELGWNIRERPTITYSTNGKMVGVCYWYSDSAVISIHDVISGVHMHSHSLGTPFEVVDLHPNNGSTSDDGPILGGGPVPDGMVSKRTLVSSNSPVSNKRPVSVSNNSLVSNIIWTHGESLRFATVGSTTITIWEVGFTSETSPTEVETLSVPNDVLSALPPHLNYSGSADRVQFLPTSCRLAIVHQGKVLVWDGRNSKPLLSQTDTRCSPVMSFSSDGRFFACSTNGCEAHLWEDSPTGYAFRGTLVSVTKSPGLLLSPNGESIVTFGDPTIQLWHTKSFIAPPSSTLTQSLLGTVDFALDFSPGGTSAMVVRREDKVATVLDLKSGTPLLTVDASMGIYGLRVTEDSAVVVCDGKVITWNLPAGDLIPNFRVTVNDSTRAINFSGSEKGKVLTASISPNLHHVVLMTQPFTLLRHLYIYSASTRKYLGYHFASENGLWFAPDGRTVWCVDSNGDAEAWAVTESGSTEPLGASRVNIEHPPEGCPWGSSRGYRVTNDWWVLGPDGKRLLMLPPPWRSRRERRVWNGRFLALLHGALLEPVILELGS